MVDVVAIGLVVMSPAVGSFLGVLADRLPRGEDVVRRPSFCRSCGARLGVADLVPVLSCMASAGRCRRCGAGIPGHLLRIELAAIAAALAAVAIDGGAGRMLATAGYLWCLTALFYADLLHFRLPDALTAALALCGLGIAAADPGRSLAGAVLAGAGLAAVFLALRLGYRRLRGVEGMGLGDVKLAAGLGAGLGASALPVTCLLAATIALASAGLSGWCAGRLPDRVAAVPFGAALAAAAAMVLVARGLRLFG